MICHVVCEGPADALLLRRLLEPEVPGDDSRVHIIEAGGWSLADSTARSILAVRHEPVALVVDADGTSPEVVEERRRFLEESLGAVSTSPNLFRVFLFVPEMEAIVFQGTTPDQLKKHLKRGIPYPLPAEMKLEARYAPRRVLESIGITPGKLQQLLATMDLSSAKETTIARDLRKFVFDHLGTVRSQRSAAR